MTENSRKTYDDLYQLFSAVRILSTKLKESIALNIENNRQAFTYVYFWRTNGPLIIIGKCLIVLSCFVFQENVRQKLDQTVFEAFKHRLNWATVILKATKE